MFIHWCSYIGVHTLVFIHWCSYIVTNLCLLQWQQWLAKQKYFSFFMIDYGITENHSVLNLKCICIIRLKCLLPVQQCTRYHRVSCGIQLLSIFNFCVIPSFLAITRNYDCRHAHRKKAENNCFGIWCLNDMMMELSIVVVIFIIFFFIIIIIIIITIIIIIIIIIIINILIAILLVGFGYILYGQSERISETESD